MRNLFLLIWMFSLQSNFCLAQLNPDAGRVGGAVRLPSTAFLDEVFGKPFNPSEILNIKGSPFLEDKWKISVLRHKDGRFFENIPVKLNLYTGNIHYLSARNELVVPAGLITGVMFTDTLENGTMQERNFISLVGSGYDLKNPWYEIVENGRASLLSHTSLKINESNLLGTTVIEKEFMQVSDYWLLVGENLLKCKKEKAFFVESLADEMELVQKYIDDHKLKCKSLKDFKEIVHYYNSLVPEKLSPGN